MPAWNLYARWSCLWPCRTNIGPSKSGFLRNRMRVKPKMRQDFRLARVFLVPFLGWKISPQKRVCVSTGGSARWVRWIKSSNAPTLPNLFEATIIHLHFRFMIFIPTHPWFPPPFNVWETPRIEVGGSHGIHDVFLAKLKAEGWCWWWLVTLCDFSVFLMIHLSHLI